MLYSSACMHVVYLGYLAVKIYRYSELILTFLTDLLPPKSVNTSPSHVVEKERRKKLHTYGNIVHTFSIILYSHNRLLFVLFS